MKTPAIWRNALTRKAHEYKRRQLRAAFPDLETCKHESFLSLGAYLSESPARFFSRRSRELYAEFLTQHASGRDSLLRNTIRTNTHSLSEALRVLDEINGRTWGQKPLPSNETEQMRVVERVLHPEYLQLLESVLGPFLRLAAYASRCSRGKPIEGLDLFNCYEELRHTEYELLTSPYRHVPRNAIAHGGVLFRQNEIVYTDKKGRRESLGYTALLELVDETVDTCNGIALAFRAHCLQDPESLEQLPRQILLDEMRAEAESPWWLVSGILEAEVLQGSQLTVYVDVRTRDVNKVLFSSFATAASAEAFSPGYDRYFMSLRSRLALPGWAGFKGAELRRLREKESDSHEEYAATLADGGLFFVPHLRLPRLLHRVWSLVLAFAINWPETRDELRALRGRPVVDVRTASIHRNGCFSVIRANVVVRNWRSEEAAAVMHQARGILRRAVRKARRQTQRWWACRYLPVGYVRVAVFRQDYRKRKLLNFGLNPDLVCTIARQRLRRTRVPDLWSARVETSRGCRIAWNQVWEKAKE